MRLIKQLFNVFVVLMVLGGILMLFSYDVIKIQWVSFMGLQPSFGNMEDPLPVPARSIPVEGPAYIPNMGAPNNPVPADQASITRGAELFAINCKMCHGTDGKGTEAKIAPYLLQFKPADLTGVIVQSLSDGGIFLTISNGKAGRMPALNENLTVRERWDVVNFVRTLAMPAPTPTP
jgi:mono/diheme cytochrome c family protein